MIFEQQRSGDPESFYGYLRALRRILEQEKRWAIKRKSGETEGILILTL
jgi:hypothetical protein